MGNILQRELLGQEGSVKIMIDPDVVDENGVG